MDARHRPACNYCRKSKRKCDRAVPCGTCLKYKKTCTYASQDASRKVEKEEVTADIENYFELYFETLNPMKMHLDNSLFSISLFKQTPISTSKLLQLHSILATSTRVFSPQSNAFREYESSATKFASDLFDDFSFETALGFYFFAFHYWGQDQELCDHYTDIATSLCRRVASKATTTPKIQKMALRLLICSLTQLRGSDSPCPILDSAFYDIVTKLRELEESHPEEQINQTTLCMTCEEFLSFVSFKMEFQKNIFETKGKITCLARIDNYTYDSLRCLMENIDCIIITKFLNVRTNVFLGANYAEFLRAALLYCVGNSSGAIFHIEKLIGSFASNSKMIRASGPYFMSVFHYSLLIAIGTERFDLAQTISNFQQTLCQILPGYKKQACEDFSYLQSFLRQQNT